MKYYFMYWKGQTISNLQWKHNSSSSHLIQPEVDEGVAGDVGHGQDVADEEYRGGVEGLRGLPAPVRHEVVEVEGEPGHGEEDDDQDQHLDRPPPAGQSPKN